MYLISNLWNTSNYFEMVMIDDVQHHQPLTVYHLNGFRLIVNYLNYVQTMTVALLNHDYRLN